jgi:hypothetical protein
MGKPNFNIHILLRQRGPLFKKRVAHRKRRSRHSHILSNTCKNNMNIGLFVIKYVFFKYLCKKYRYYNEKYISWRYYIEVGKSL